MQRLTVIFGRSYRPISLLIQLWTWGRWSHVGVLVDGEVIEAVGGQGVVRTPLDDFKSRYHDYEIGTIPCENADAAKTLLNLAVGKRYDKRALWGIALRTGVDDANAYQCSELVAKATGLFRTTHTSRTTPEQIWRISR